MAYIPDLTPYNYGHTKPREDVLAVGWLDETDPFQTGPVDQSIVERILTIPVMNLYRGSHRCPWCIHLTRPGTQGIAGNGEYRIMHEGITYVAPRLLPHYMEAHQYRPPDIFIEAIKKGA
jgi:hypothetical protein